MPTNASGLLRLPPTCLPTSGTPATPRTYRPGAYLLAPSGLLWVVTSHGDHAYPSGHAPADARPLAYVEREFGPLLEVAP